MLRREFVFGLGVLLASCGRSPAQGVAAIKAMKPGVIWRPQSVIELVWSPALPSP
jgi:hypothetical protein